MSKPLDLVGEQQIDTFQELGNIGAGNAATALSSVLQMKVNMSLPRAKIVSFNDIVNILNGPENLVAGVLVTMSGDLKGYVLMILELKDALEMAETALQSGQTVSDPPQIEMMSDLHRSTLEEIANMLCGAYLAAVGSMTGLRIGVSVPQLAVDMVGAILSIALVEYGNIGDSVLFLQTDFSDENKKMTGHFFLISEFESYRILMKSLGMDG